MAIDPPRAALAGFVFVVAVALLVAGSTSGSAFGTYNPAWDGTAEFRALADETDTDQTIARNVSAYRTPAPSETLAVVLSPESAYDASERDRVQQFVREGGTLLVADDFESNGNRLLGAVGAQARFDGATVRDERNYENGPALPVASTVGNSSYTSGVERIVLNHGTTIDEPGSTDAGNATNLTIVAETSSYAYLDRNDNAELDGTETLASSPVVTVEPIGEGQVIAVSDPSVFINTMLERGDNRRFARNLYERHDRVILDVSHGGVMPPFRALVLTLRTSTALQLVVGGAVLALLVGWESLLAGGHAFGRRVGRSRPSSRSLDRETVIRGVRDRHPEWDQERVERITEAIMARQPEGGSDD